MQDYSWISQLATECKDYSLYIGTYFARAIVLIDIRDVPEQELKRSWSVIARDLVHFRFDEQSPFPPDLHATLDAFHAIVLNKINQEIIDEKKLALTIHHFLQQAFDTLSKNPQLLEVLDQMDLIEDMAATIAGKYVPLIKLLPVFSQEAMSLLPYLKEPLFTALYELSEDEQIKITSFTQKILYQYYTLHVRKQLEITLQANNKGKNLLLPLIDEAVDHLPHDRCMTALISILCTPKGELSQGRIISIILQELGGLYVKLAQVLAELAPPALARELRHQQDRLGGIFGSEEKSWKYVLEILQRPTWGRIRSYIHIPERTQGPFAGASVGAIYEFELTETGKRKLQMDRSILLKIQRPGLKSLFEEQKNTILSILNKVDTTLPGTGLNETDQEEIRGLTLALRRTIINYATQSIGELDFRVEKKNSDHVREALKGQFDLQIPQYFHAETDVAMMERLTGDKITTVVHNRYLERMSIADLVSDAYLYLMFRKGLIWADPHAGNILYDADKLQVKLIDLNPCFTWDTKTIHQFIAFIYRLILGDQKGIFESLKALVENPEDLKLERNQKLIKDFISRGNNGAFIRYLSDFVRLMGETNIDLRIEIQAALRGLTQVYLTAGAISSRHNFGQLFQKQFDWKVLTRVFFEIGIFKIFRAALPLAFDAVTKTPEEEVGPTLDERDLTAIAEALIQLNSESVCTIELVRSSPEDNTRLTMATDGSRLIKSSHLQLEVLTETKPASVKYLVETPSKEWLKDRQEYVKLQGMGYTLCLVECLEQLRRHSLEDYWYVVESWNTPPTERSFKETSLIGDVQLAARVLFSRRFRNIWDTEFMTVSRWNRFLWKLLIRLEERFERREQGYFYLLSKKGGHQTVGSYTIGTIQRVKVIIYRLVISGLKGLIKRSRFDMNLLPLTTIQLTHRMLHGLLRGSPYTLRRETSE